MLYLKLSNLTIDAIIMKTVPTVSGFLTFLGFGIDPLGFVVSLLVATAIKVLLTFFEKEIRGFSLGLRKKWDSYRLKKRDNVDRR